MSKKKDIAVLIIGKILQVVISLVSVRLLTEYLSESEVGSYYLLLSLLACFNFTLLNPLGQFYARHLISWEKSKNLLNATNFLLLARACITCIGLLVACFVFYSLGYSDKYKLFDFILFVAISLTAGMNGVLLSAVNYLGDRLKFIKYSVLILLFGLIFSVSIVIYVQNSGMAWLYGAAFSQLFFSCFLYNILKKNCVFSINKIINKLTKKYIIRVLLFSTPISLTLFLQWGQSNSYRFIVESKYSIEALAFLAVGLSVSTSVFKIVEGLSTQYFNPIYFKEISNATKAQREHSWNQLASYMFPIYILLIAFIVGTSPFLIKMLVAEKFQQAYIYTMFGAFIEFFRVSTNIVYMVSQSELKTNTTIIPYAAGFLFLITTLYFFDFGHVMWGIPVILIISSFIVFVSLYFSMRRLLDIRIDYLRVGKALLLSIPLYAGCLLDVKLNVAYSFSIVLMMGIILLFEIYILMPKNKEVI